MSEFPKHEKAAPRKKPQPAQTAAVPVAPTFPDNLFLSGLDALEIPLEKIAHTFRSYHANLCDVSLSNLALFTDPLKITLADNDHSDKVREHWKRLAKTSKRLLPRCTQPSIWLPRCTQRYGQSSRAYRYRVRAHCDSPRSEVSTGPNSPWMRLVWLLALQADGQVVPDFDGDIIGQVLESSNPGVVLRLGLTHTPNIFMGCALIFD